MKFETALLDEYEVCWGYEVGTKMEGPDGNEWECVSKEYVGSRRWSEEWRSVFKINDEFWSVDWEQPSTEMQEDQGNWGYEEEVEFHQVYPHKVERTIYKREP